MTAFTKEAERGSCSLPSQMKLRDDFLGLTRLMDRIIADPVIMDRLKDKAPKK